MYTHSYSHKKTYYMDRYSTHFHDTFVLVFDDLSPRYPLNIQTLEILRATKGHFPIKNILGPVLLALVPPANLPRNYNVYTHLCSTYRLSEVAFAALHFCYSVTINFMRFIFVVAKPARVLFSTAWGL